jgi:hypothetical protein
LASFWTWRRAKRRRPVEKTYRLKIEERDHVLLVRSIGWFARGIRGPARDAMLSDAVPEEAVGRAFGFHRAVDTAGAVIGPALAVALITTRPRFYACG